MQPGGAVQLVGRGESGIGDDRPASYRAVDDGTREFGELDAHVVGDDQRLGLEEVREGCSEGTGDVDAQLGPGRAPNDRSWRP